MFQSETTETNLEKIAHQSIRYSNNLSNKKKQSSNYAFKWPRKDSHSIRRDFFQEKR